MMETEASILYQKHNKEIVLGYHLIQVYKELTDQEEQNVIDFWKREQAVVDPIEAKRRVKEVAYVICNNTWQIVGISTAKLWEQAEERYYYYRMFIRTQDRIGYLSTQVLHKTRDYLSQYASEDNVNGFLVVTQNRKMMRPGFKRYFERHQYQYLGVDQDGCDRWLTRYI